MRRIPLDEHNSLYVVDERFTKVLFLPTEIFAFVFGSTNPEDALRQIVEYIENNPEEFAEFKKEYKHDD